MQAKIVATTLLLCFYSCCYAQNKFTDTSTTIFPNFKKGEKKSFQIKETSIQYSGFRTLMKSSVLYHCTMEIVEDSINNYLIEWNITKLSVEHDKFPVYLLLAGMRDGLTIRYKINKQGMPIEFLNLTEVIQRLKRSYDSLIVLQKFDAVNEALANQFPTFLTTPGGIVDVFLKPLFLYHAAYGGEFALHQPNYRAEDARNAFGDLDFPTSVIVELSQLNPAKDFAQLIIDQVASKELTALILAERFKEITEDITGKNAKDGELPKQIRMKDHNEFDIILSTGWLSRVYYERITKDGLNKKVDTMEIVMH
jgi:hypothetical protein